MESVNTQEEMDQAVEAICKMRGIEQKEVVSTGNRYQDLQKRIRDMEEKKLESDDEFLS